MENNREDEVIKIGAEGWEFYIGRTILYLKTHEGCRIRTSFRYLEKLEFIVSLLKGVGLEEKGRENKKVKFQAKSYYDNQRNTNVNLPEKEVNCIEVTLEKIGAIK